jgi:hypothetical protein
VAGTLLKHGSAAILSVLVAIPIAFMLAGCQTRSEPPSHRYGIPASPDEYTDQFKDALEEYKKFETIDAAAEYAGYTFRYPRSDAAGRIFGVFVYLRSKTIIVLFEDYPPRGMYLSIRQLPRKPDYKARVERTVEEITQGKAMVFSPPELVNVAGHEGEGEEPSMQGPERTFPVAGHVMWWDNGVEYTLFGKADGKTPSTTLDELIAVASSCY